jgi:hypothetical protein
MKKYDVYFEIYGKKMKAKVFADSMTEAKMKITEKIIFHKIVPNPNDEFNEASDILDQMSDMFGFKKP